MARAAVRYFRQEHARNRAAIPRPSRVIRPAAVVATSPMPTTAATGRYAATMTALEADALPMATSVATKAATNAIMLPAGLEANSPEDATMIVVARTPIEMSL